MTTEVQIIPGDASAGVLRLDAPDGVDNLSIGSGSDLKPGEIEFYQGILPPLAGGKYRLVSGQKVELKAEQQQYDLISPFAIAGPRFRLQPGDVQQVYPPADLTGNWEQSLPHVVFRLPTLPWSRTIDGSAPSGDAVTTPWLALLTLYPDEAPAGLRQVTLRQLLKPAEPNVLGPLIDKDQFTEAELDEKLLSIDIPANVFLGITPTMADLPLLAHARQVNTDGKEILGMVADGYFSLLIGNRLPKTDSLNTAYAVSLEGQQTRIRGNAAPPAGSSVRVAVLASWSFTARAARGDFIDILQKLKVRGGIDLLQMPHNAISGTEPEEVTAKEALEIGYVPLRNNLRDGEETTSWYRSPGVPQPTSNDPNGPYDISDRAIRYDPGKREPSSPAGSGLFNVAYAAAWQIGRLLALSDAAFARQLFDWRRTLQIGHNKAQLLDDLAGRLPKGPATAMTLKSLHDAPEALAGFWLALGGSLRDAPQVVPHENRGDADLPGVEPEDALRLTAVEDGDPLQQLMQRMLALPLGAFHTEEEER